MKRTSPCSRHACRLLYALITHRATTVTNCLFRSAIESDITVRLRNHNNTPAQDCLKNFTLVSSSVHYDKHKARSIPEA